MQGAKTSRCSFSSFMTKDEPTSFLIFSVMTAEDVDDIVEDSLFLLRGMICD